MQDVSRAGELAAVSQVLRIAGSERPLQRSSIHIVDFGCRARSGHPNLGFGGLHQAQIGYCKYRPARYIPAIVDLDQLEVFL